MSIEYKIGDFLKRVRNPVEIEDGTNYKRVTIKGNHHGVYLRDKALGLKIGTKKQFVINGGDFILSKIDARYGAFGIVPDELDGAIITGNFWTYKVDAELVDPEWFLCFTNSFNFIQICKESSTGTTHRKYLNEKTFLSQRIFLPHKKEQKEIVVKYRSSSLISDLCVKEIQNQKQLVAMLKKSILQDAIQGKLTESWRGENPGVESATDLLERVKAEKASLTEKGKIGKKKPFSPIAKTEIPFELPENWCWSRLGDVITTAENLNIHNTFSPGTLINYVDIDAINNKTQEIRGHKILPVNQLSSRARRVLKKGNIMYALVRPYLNNLAIVEYAPEPYIGSTGFVVFDTDPVEKMYIFWLLLSRYIEETYMEYMDGFNSPSITQHQFKNTIFPLPPLEEQKAIVQKVESLAEKCRLLEAEISQSEQQAKMLMQAFLKEAFEPKEVLVV